MASIDYTSFVIGYSNSIYNATRPITSLISQPLIPIFDLFYTFIQSAERSTALNREILIYLSFLLLSYPLAIINRFLSPNTPRHVFSLFWGLLFCFLAFNWYAVHAIIVPLVVYYSMHILPRGFVHKFAFAFCFTYLILCHVYHMAIHYGGQSPDFNILQMLITLKTISVAFNYSDGEKLNSRENTPEKIQICEKHPSLVIDHLPTLLEYFAYLFFYPTVLCGPIYEYRDYNSWANNPTLSFSLSEVLKRLAFVVLNTFIYIIAVPLFPRAALIEPGITNLRTFWNRMLYAWGITTFYRTKFYVAWYLAEGACITAGFGHTARGDWDAIKQVDFIKVEMGSNVRKCVKNWNMSVVRWMHNYVYKRTSKNYSILLTILTSTLWHGLYPGYLLSSLAISSAAVVHRTLHKNLRPLIFRSIVYIHDFSQEPYVLVCVYHGLGFVITQLIIAYFGSSFQLLDLQESLHWYDTMYWVGHIILFVTFLLSAALPRNDKVKEL